MAIVGDWTLHFDWGCTGDYAQVGITFNNDGTFNIPAEGNSGRWVQNDGMILFQYDVQFDTYNTTYGGNLAGNVMAGMSSTFAAGSVMAAGMQSRWEVQQCGLKNANQNSIHLAKRQNIRK